jgi:hypothetical protein
MLERLGDATKLEPRGLMKKAKEFFKDQYLFNESVRWGPPCHPLQSNIECLSVHFVHYFLLIHDHSNECSTNLKIERIPLNHGKGQGVLQGPVPLQRVRKVGPTLSPWQRTLRRPAMGVIQYKGLSLGFRCSLRPQAYQRALVGGDTLGNRRGYEGPRIVGRTGRYRGEDDPGRLQGVGD